MATPVEREDARSAGLKAVDVDIVTQANRPPGSADATP